MIRQEKKRKNSTVNRYIALYSIPQSPNLGQLQEPVSARYRLVKLRFTKTRIFCIL